MANAATYHYVRTALEALAPVALAAFLGGFVFAWFVWRVLLGRKGKR